jgi:phosphoglycerate dehydrogenase-like enzyme
MLQALPVIHKGEAVVRMDRGAAMNAEPTFLNVLFTWVPEQGLESIESVEGVQIQVAGDRARMLELIADADVACVGDLDAELLAAAPRLRWVQALMGGVETVLFPELQASPVLLTSCKECFAVPGSEHALAVMLAFSRRLEYDIRRRPYRSFTYTEPEELKGKTVGILGVGNMGRAIARKCRCFDMRVLGLARRSRTTTEGDFDAIYTREQMPDLLAQSDFVVVTVPLTPETVGMIGSKEIAQMQPTAYLIDVSGRPAIYDLAALEAALRADRIAGANLQIVPPADSSLWELENLLISFHRTTSRQEVGRCFELFAENLRRFQTGTPLLSLVDKAAGY